MFALHFILASFFLLASGHPHEERREKFVMFPCIPVEMRQFGESCYAAAHRSLNASSFSDRPECSESSQSAECKQLKVHAMREAAIDCLVRPSGAINEAGELDVDKYYATVSTAFQQIDLNDASKQNILDSARACFQSPVPSPYTMFHYRPENIQPHMRNLVSGTQYHLNMGELRPSSAMVASDCLTTALLHSDCIPSPEYMERMYARWSHRAQ